MEKGKISVIVPVYNVERYVKWTIKAILNQTYTNFELILVNDGSTDGSEKVCKDFVSQDSRIRLITISNSGPSAARNRGIDEATGEYICFIDSDDIVSKFYFERFIEAYDTVNPDLVICGYRRFYNDKLDDNVKYVLTNYSMSLMMNQKELASLFLVAKTNLSGVAIWAKMYRTSIIKEHNIRFPLDICYEEDCIFNLLYYRHVGKTVALKWDMYNYRQTTTGLSKAYDGSKFKFLINGFNERKKYLAEVGYTEEEIKAADAIFVIVVIANYRKIFNSSLTKEEKIKDIADMFEYPDVTATMDNCGLSAVPFTRDVTLATRERNAEKIYGIFESEPKYEKKKLIKSKLKKFLKKFFR